MTDPVARPPADLVGLVAEAITAFARHFALVGGVDPEAVLRLHRFSALDVDVTFGNTTGCWWLKVTPVDYFCAVAKPVAG